MIRRRMHTILSLGFFVLLCIAFYYSLIHATNKYKNKPIKIPTNRYQATGGEPSKMQILFEKCTKWAKQSRSQKLATLLNNPVYKTLKITKPRVSYKKKKVNVLLIVSTGPRRSDRREAIRDTWWKDCKQTYRIVPECLFFTDLQKPGDKFYKNITKEQNQYNDLNFQPLHGGIEFGIRFIYHMVWAMTYYEFDYFLRVDDDYFFCLQRFLYELYSAPVLTNFHWGYTHCIHEMIRPEESLLLFSRDIVENFLLQDPQSIRCHPWADQMIGVWVTDMNILQLFRHDDRVHHAPIVSEVPSMRRLTKVCQQYMGIHGAYGKDMRLFWKNRGIIPIFNTTEERDKAIGNLIDNSVECEKPHNFNFLRFESDWQYEPQRCIYNPKWNTKKQKLVGGVYSGRQDDKNLAEADVRKFGRIH